MVACCLGDKRLIISSAVATCLAQHRTTLAQVVAAIGAAAVTRGPVGDSEGLMSDPGDLIVRPSGDEADGEARLARRLACWATRSTASSRSVMRKLRSKSCT